MLVRLIEVRSTGKVIMGEVMSLRDILDTDIDNVVKSATVRKWDYLPGVTGQAYTVAVDNRNRDSLAYYVGELVKAKVMG
jgi:hypothetical protein